MARLPGGMAQVGLFEAANQIRLAITFIPMIAGRAALPILANSLQQGHVGLHRTTIRINMMLSIAIALCAAGVAFLFNEQILGLYGSQFSRGTDVLNVLLLVGLLAAVAGVVGHAIASLDKMWWGMGFNAIWATALLIGAAYLTPLWSARGLAVALLAAYGLHVALQAVFVNRHLSRLHPQAGAGMP